MQVCGCYRLIKPVLLVINSRFANTNLLQACHVWNTMSETEKFRFLNNETPPTLQTTRKHIAYMNSTLI